MASLTVARSALTMAAIAGVAACRAPVSEPLEEAEDLVQGLQVTPVPSMPTVLDVSWTTTLPVQSRLIYGVDGLLDRATPQLDAPATEHQVRIVGLPPESVVSVAPESDGLRADILAVETGPLPLALTPAAVAGGAQDRFLTTGLSTETSATVAVLDRSGRVSWVHADARGLSVIRARPSLDGTGIWYAATSPTPSAETALVHVAWDGTEDIVLPVADLANDFVELADGTLVAVRHEIRDGVVGNDIVQVDAAGTTTPIWSTWDCFDPVQHPGTDPELGWSSANALDADEATGLYWLGLSNLGTITAVDTTSRSCPLAFGGAAGTVAIDGATFSGQSQFEWAGDNLLVFDNAGDPAGTSRAIDYAFDEASAVASEVAIFDANPPLTSARLGDVHRTDGGATLVTWSDSAVVERYDTAGAKVWRLEWNGPEAFGFMTATPTLDAVAP